MPSFMGEVPSKSDEFLLIFVANFPRGRVIGALEAVNVLALATGVAYAVLAARRNRLCWIAGAVSSACAVVLAGLNKLPMQAALQVFYVAMSVYGWWSWKRSAGEGELQVGVWPLRRHLGAALVLAALSLVSAYWLRPANV